MNTMFLATVIGWFLVIVSIFLFFRHEHMKSVMDDVIAHPGLFFVFAVFTLILGLLVRAREQNRLCSRYFANEPTIFCE